MNERWIKLYPKMTKWEWYEDINTFRVFMHLLLTCNYTKKNWRGVDIEAGQIVTSVAKLSEQCGISPMKIRTCLNRLKSTNEITSKPTTKYTLITICKWADYQCMEIANNADDNKQNNKRITNEQQTNNKQITTTQEREERIEREEYKEEPKGSLSDLPSDSPNPPSETIDFDGIINQFNAVTKGAFGTLRHPMGEKRKKNIRARIATYGRGAIDEVMQRAMKSDFLKGQNARGFTATFDWMILPSNFEKIISGNYDNKKTAATSAYQRSNQNSSSGETTRQRQLREAQEKLLGKYAPNDQ